MTGSVLGAELPAVAAERARQRLLLRRAAEEAAKAVVPQDEPAPVLSEAAANARAHILARARLQRQPLRHKGLSSSSRQRVSHTQLLRFFKQHFGETGQLRGAVAAAVAHVGAAAAAAAEEQQAQGALVSASMEHSATATVQAQHRGKQALAKALAAAREAHAGERQAREVRRRTDVLAEMSRAALRLAREQARKDQEALDAREVEAFYAGQAAQPMSDGLAPGHASLMPPVTDADLAGTQNAGGDGSVPPFMARDWDVPPPVGDNGFQPVPQVGVVPDHPDGVAALERARAAFEAELEAAERMYRRTRAHNVAIAARLGAVPPPPEYARRSLAAVADARLDAERAQRRAWQRTAAPSIRVGSANARSGLPPRPASPEPGARSSVRKRPAFNRFVGPSRTQDASASEPHQPQPAASRRSFGRQQSSSPPIQPLRSAALDAADAIRGNTFEVLARLEERLFGQAAAARGAAADAQRRAAGGAMRRRRRRADASTTAAMSLSERDQLIAAAAAAGAQAAMDAMIEASSGMAPEAVPAPPAASFAAPASMVAPGKSEAPTGWQGDALDSIQPWSSAPTDAARAAMLTDEAIAALLDAGLLGGSEEVPERAAQAARNARRAPPPASSSSGGDADAQAALEAMRHAAAQLAQVVPPDAVHVPDAHSAPVSQPLSDLLASLSDKIASLDASLRTSGSAEVGRSPRTPRGSANAVDTVGAGTSGASSLDDVDVHLRRIKDTLATLAQPLPLSGAAAYQFGSLPPPPASRQAYVQQPSMPAGGGVVDYTVFQSPSTVPASPGTRATLLEEMGDLLRETYVPGEPASMAGVAPEGGLTPMRWSATGRLPTVPEAQQGSADPLLDALIGMPRRTL